MPVEIERKFLVEDDWKDNATILDSIVITQGYFTQNKERTVRVRTYGDLAFLTIKGGTVGISRLEFEYEIPHIDALELLKICEKNIIAKQRHLVKHTDGFLWEIDEFEGDNEGLTVAEIELASEDEKFDLPQWVSKEVTADYRYFNAYIASNPYSKWKND